MEAKSREKIGSRQTNQAKKKTAKKSILPWVVSGAVVGLAMLAVISFAAWKLFKPVSGPRSTGEVQQATRPTGVTQQPAIKIAVETTQGVVDRVVPARSGNGQAGICYQLSEAGKGSYFFDRYEGATGKRLSHTELTGVKVPQQVALSPDGSRLAVAALATDEKVFRSAVTLWSLADGRVLQSSWKPYPDGDIFDVLAWVAFSDADHLLTLTTGGRLSLWDLDGKASYAVQHGKRTNNSFRTSPYTKQPQNFALSADQHTLALFNGEGFDIIDTATGKARGQTAAFVDKPSTTILGTALDSEGQRLAVYVRLTRGQQSEEVISVWNLKTGQPAGSFPIRIQRDKPAALPAWGGAALGWWGSNHLLLWNGNGLALVLEASSGKGVRELLGPPFGKHGYVDGAARLWYEFVIPGKKAWLCALDFPSEDLQRYPGLEEGKYYPRWCLNEEGVETRPGPKDFRTWPRVGPAN